MIRKSAIMLGLLVIALGISALVSIAHSAPYVTTVPGIFISIQNPNALQGQSNNVTILVQNNDRFQVILNGAPYLIGSGRTEFNTESLSLGGYTMEVIDLVSGADASSAFRIVSTNTSTVIANKVPTAQTPPYGSTGVSSGISMMDFVYIAVVCLISFYVIPLLLTIYTRTFGQRPRKGRSKR